MSRVDVVTGRVIREGETYLEEDTWIVWVCEAEDGKRACLKRKGQHPEVAVSATGEKFRDCVIDGDHEPQNIGEYTGRYIDALRFMHEVLGFEPYTPFDCAFENSEEEE